VRSSRAIERHCRQDVAYRPITGNLVADRATIARFICRHERALAALFSEVLGLCQRAGLVRSGVVSIDGTRIAGDCSPEVNQTFEQIARQILVETRARDEAEDEEFGEGCGDELPEGLRTPEGRREFFRQARGGLGREDGSFEVEEREVEAGAEVRLGLDAERIVARVQGREGWLREGKRQLERHRLEDPDLIHRARKERLLLAAERLEIDLDVERRSNQAYEAYRAQGRIKDGRRFGGPPNPYIPPDLPAGKVNLTDRTRARSRLGSGSCRASTRRRRSTSSSSCWRRRSPTVRLTSRSLTRWSPPPWTSSSGRASISSRKRSRPTPATGTSSTWTRWWPTSTSRCWSHPTRAAAVPLGAGGRADVTRGREPCSAQSTDGSGTRNAKQTTEPTFGNTKHNKGCHPLSPQRQDQGAHRVAIDDHDREPHQGSPSPGSHCESLKRLRRGDTSHTTPPPPPPTLPPPVAALRSALPRSHPPTARQVCATASTRVSSAVRRGGALCACFSPKPQLAKVRCYVRSASAAASAGTRVTTSALAVQASWLQTQPRSECPGPSEPRALDLLGHVYGGPAPGASAGSTAVRRR
jgi:hypothetical protein